MTDTGAQWIADGIRSLAKAIVIAMWLWQCSGAADLDVLLSKVADR